MAFYVYTVLKDAPSHLRSGLREDGPFTDAKAARDKAKQLVGDEVATLAFVALVDGDTYEVMLHWTKPDRAKTILAHMMDVENLLEGRSKRKVVRNDRGD
jgi:hypothetical protein